MILTKRFQQAMFQTALAMNRAASSGGGSGFQPAFTIGDAAAGDQGGYSTANASTWTDITNSSFNFTISRATNFLWLIVVAGARSAGAGTVYARGTITGFDSSASIPYNGASIDNGMMWYVPFTSGPIQPGSYTAKLQAATDAGNTLHVYQLAHLILIFGQ